MRVFNLEQGSPEWILWRKSGIGSSDAPVIVHGKHFNTTRGDLWKEKLGRIKSKVFNPYVQKRMDRGKEQEPNARAWYENFIGLKADPIVCMHPYLDWMKGSLDGYIPHSRTILEIKCPNPKDHYGALNHVIPEKYIPQINHLILVTGSIHAHYLSFFPELESKKERCALISYYPDSKDLERLMKLEEIFWKCVEEKREPFDHLFI